MKKYLQNSKSELKSLPFINYIIRFILLKVENISFSRGTKLIIDDISFEAKSNSILAILGPNGAGKSTLLNIFSGYLDNYKGKVFINNFNIKELKPQKLSHIRSVVPQKSNLNIPFKVIDVVMMGRSPYDKIEQKVNYDISLKAIKDVGIEEYIEKEYTNLSGGEQQRVHIARALAQIAYNNDIILNDNNIDYNKFLFLDEHTSNLDIGRSYQLMKICRKFINNNFGIIWVVHDINLALDFADKFLLLKKGKVLAYGSKEIITEDLISELYDIKIEKKVIENNRVFFVPEVNI